MDPDDQEKTSFVKAQGTYCYRYDAIWAQERRSYLSKAGEQDVPEAYRNDHGGVHR